MNAEQFHIAPQKSDETALALASLCDFKPVTKSRREAPARFETAGTLRFDDEFRRERGRVGLVEIFAERKVIAIYIEIRYLYVTFEIVRFFTVKIRRTRVPHGNEGAQFALCPSVKRRVDRTAFLCQKTNRAVEFS